ncbi:MAG: tRNA-binding protein [Cyclobacteriaceae bacterium]|nr:tRNA-binding protein [Cyclobacteriaceae bacterium]
MEQINWKDFEKIELRVGEITKVETFPEARNPAYKIWVNLGELGIKKSSAQITHHYEIGELIGKQVICVCNFPVKQIGSFLSEILITGFPDTNNNVILATSDKNVPNGVKLF